MSQRKVIAAEDVGAYRQQLLPDTVTEIVFEPFEHSGRRRFKLEVVADGAAEVYFTVDDREPTVAGDRCHFLPAIEGVVREIWVGTNRRVTVSLISDGPVTVNVSKAMT